MMSVSTIREAIQARPFRPFTVYVADQRSYRVPHPEYIAIGSQGRTLAIFHDDGGVSVLDMLLISGIDVAPAAPSDGPH
jgi:hypothetical protein